MKLYSGMSYMYLWSTDLSYNSTWNVSFHSFLSFFFFIAMLCWLRYMLFRCEALCWGILHSIDWSYNICDVLHDSFLRFLFFVIVFVFIAVWCWLRYMLLRCEALCWGIQDSIDWSYNSICDVSHCSFLSLLLLLLLLLFFFFIVFTLLSSMLSFGCTVYAV